MEACELNDPERERDFFEAFEGDLEPLELCDFFETFDGDPDPDFLEGEREPDPLRADPLRADPLRLRLEWLDFPDL